MNTSGTPRRRAPIDSLTYGLSKELAGDGIRVNCVSPGCQRTRVHADAGTPDKLARIAPMIPIGRAGKPEEQAEAVLFLLSDAASYISGTVLRVAGGRIGVMLFRPVRSASCAARSFYDPPDGRMPAFQRQLRDFARAQPGRETWLQQSGCTRPAVPKS